MGAALKGDEKKPTSTTVYFHGRLLLTCGCHMVIFLDNLSSHFHTSVLQKPFALPYYLINASPLTENAT